MQQVREGFKNLLDGDFIKQEGNEVKIIINRNRNIDKNRSDSAHIAATQLSPRLTDFMLEEEDEFEVSDVGYYQLTIKQKGGGKKPTVNGIKGVVSELLNNSSTLERRVHFEDEEEKPSKELLLKVANNLKLGASSNNKATGYLNLKDNYLGFNEKERKAIKQYFAQKAQQFGYKFEESKKHSDFDTIVFCKEELTMQTVDPLKQYLANVIERDFSASQSRIVDTSNLNPESNPQRRLPAVPEENEVSTKPEIRAQDPTKNRNLKPLTQEVFKTLPEELKKNVNSVMQSIQKENIENKAFLDEQKNSVVIYVKPQDFTKAIEAILKEKGEKVLAPETVEMYKKVKAQELAQASSHQTPPR